MIEWKNTSFLQNTPKPAQLCMSAVRAVTTGSLHTSLRYPGHHSVCDMNLYSKMKKKLEKNKKNIKKKIITAGELFTAGALLTAGGNMVDKLSEDSSPQITASEVTWTQDQGKALFEIKTVQRDSGLSGWGASGYIMLALGMILLAIPAIKAIQWIRRSCGGDSRTHSINKEEAEDKIESVVRYNSVKYSP